MTAKDIRFDWKLEIHFMKIQRRYNRFHSRHRNLVETRTGRRDLVETRSGRRDLVEKRSGRLSLS